MTGTPSSGNDLPHRRTPEIFTVQRSASQDSRGVYRLLVLILHPSNICLLFVIASTHTAHSSQETAQSPISPGNWVFSSNTPSNTTTHSTQPTQVTPSVRNHHRRFSDQTPGRQQHSPHSMIGPSSSFYDPEQALPQDSPDYQRWVEAYGSGPMDYNIGDHNNTDENMSQFQHHRQQPQRQQTITARTATEPVVPLQNQYQFVTGQYQPPPSSSIDHHHQYMSSSGRQLGPAGTAGRSTSDYSSSIRTHQQHPSPGSLHGAIDYNPQGMGSDLYYYPSDIVSGDQAQPPYAYPGGGTTQTYHDTSFTPSSDLHTLPPNTSVSPPWTEERLPAGYGGGPSSSSVQTPRISQTAQKREKGGPGSAKKTAGRKRARKSGAGDSDSDSDEDTFDAAPTPSSRPENIPPRL